MWVFLGWCSTLGCRCLNLEQQYVHTHTIIFQCPLKPQAGVTHLLFLSSSEQQCLECISLQHYCKGSSQHMPSSSSCWGRVEHVCHLVAKRGSIQTHPESRELAYWRQISVQFMESRMKYCLGLLFFYQLLKGVIGSGTDPCCCHGAQSKKKKKTSLFALILNFRHSKQHFTGLFSLSKHRYWGG